MAARVAGARSGEAMRGSQTERRLVSEYWTLVRPASGDASREWALARLETDREFTLS